VFTGCIPRDWRTASLHNSAVYIRNLAVAKKLHSASHKSHSGRIPGITAHMFDHCNWLCTLCLLYFGESRRTVKPCAALKDQQMSHKMSSLIRLLELSIREGEVGYSQLFSDKVTRIMLEVDVSHWRWHSSVLLCVVVMSYVSIMCCCWDIQHWTAVSHWCVLEIWVNG